MISYCCRAACLLVVSIVPANADVVARILHTKGNVEIINQENASRPARVFGGIYDNERVLVPSNGAIAIGVVASGQIEKIEKLVDTRVTQRGFAKRSEVQVVKASPKRSETTRLAISRLPRIAPGGVTIARSGEVKEPTIQPINDSSVMPTKLVFSWPKMESAKSYSIRLKRGADAIWGKANCKETHISFDGESLKSGEYYHWEAVAALPAGGQEVVGGEFRVVDEDDLELAATLIELGQQKELALISIAAGAFEDLEMYGSALSCYEKLARLAPEDVTFRAALTELYGRAGRHAEAAKSRTKAEKLGFRFRADE